jgi:hypothetical protein
VACKGRQHGTHAKRAHAIENQQLQRVNGVEVRVGERAEPRVEIAHALPRRKGRAREERRNVRRREADRFKRCLEWHLLCDRSEREIDALGGVSAPENDPSASR